MKTVIVEAKWKKDLSHKAYSLFPDLISDGGWGNGYVVLDKDHPWYGKHYNNIPVDIHGGLTYSEYIDEKDLDHFNLENEDIGKYIIGFDTFHTGDTEEKWTKEAVQEEANRLLRQCQTNNILKKI